jgi:cytochrome c oxidase assembly protein subunit 11
MAGSDATAQAASGALAASNSRTAMICAAVFALMVGAAFAAVPLYRIYCQQIR